MSRKKHSLMNTESERPKSNPRVVKRSKPEWIRRMERYRKARGESWYLDRQFEKALKKE